MKKKNIRCEQGSNLRGQCPLDFKSNALTTRPSQLDDWQEILNATIINAINNTQHNWYKGSYLITSTKT